ncbi:MAG: hypothetical protein IJ606_04700 [Bacteroidaceae bacterium]|nr:hypothetical protein [Bacteroidaceae bacterium]
MVEQIIVNKVIKGLINKESWAIKYAGKLPQMIDSAYGDGDGKLTISDVDDVVASIASSIGEKVSDVGNLMSHVLPNAGETLSNIGNTVTGLGETAASTLASTGSAIVDNGGEVMEGIGDAIIDLLDSLF